LVVYFLKRELADMTRKRDEALAKLDKEMRP
jgi:hypothetical protein